LIGPRPDYYLHALEYLKNVEGYRERHAIRPGITGLSQIRLGYVKTLEATSKKTTIDNYYIENLGYIIELKIILKTILIIMRGLGKQKFLFIFDSQYCSKEYAQFLSVCLEKRYD
jgi:lipopolysaccharide/colanic/teichoic acid biosynthesis glycosyltransferase